MNTMFDVLLQLPLFQGLCNDDFTTILEKVKLKFSKYSPGDNLITSGTPCGQLLFLLKGEVTSETCSHDNSYTFIEYTETPHLFEPHALIGISPYYVSTYSAKTEVHTVSISKEAVLNQLFNFQIFRLNYLNMLSRRAQYLHAHLWEEAPRDLEEKFVKFVLAHVEKRQGEKMLKTKMEDLAHHLDDTRLNVSRMLNGLQKEGLLDLFRKEIVISDAAQLTDWNEKRFK